MTKNSNELILTEIVNRYGKIAQDNDNYYLYKFMSFDTQLRVLNTFINSELKYSNPIDFNDPYDSHFQVNLNFNDFNKKNADTIFGKIPPSKWINNKQKVMKMLENDFSDDFTNGYRKRFSVTCFTSAPLNILMWSHYAYNHTGFVIEFKIPKFKIDQKIFNGKLAPLPVFYEDKYPQINLNWNIEKDLKDRSLHNDLLKKMMLTKARCWEYENEFRLLSETQPNLNNIILNPFDPSILSSIILGAKTDPNVHKKEISRALDLFNKKNQSNVQIFEAKLMKGKYELHVPNHPRLNKE